MKKYKTLLSILMALVLTLTFMPALAFADEEVVDNDPFSNEEIDEEDDEYVPLSPGELRVYGDGGYVENPEQFLQENGIKYPTKVVYQYCPGYDAAPFYAEYQEPVIKYSSFNMWGRQFIVDYNDNTQEVYSCVYSDDIGDCDYYLTLPEGDAEGTAYGEPANFWNTAANGDVFSKTNKTALLYMNLFFTLGEGEDMQYYFIQKACDETIEVETGAAEVYIEVRGSKSKYYTEYTGKPFKITKSKLDIWTSNYIDPKITKISPASVTAIGSHKITFTIDNSEGIYGDGKTKKVYSYFNIYPKKVTNAKASNPEKNKLKLSWMYELKSKSASKASKDAYKANYKKIDGYLVEIYDSTYNLIASKKYSKAYKNQKSVTINSKKLKKGKTYYVFIFAYKNVKGNPFRSEAVIKTIKIKK